MPNQSTATARAPAVDIVSQLAKFFPEATPVRIPIRLSRANGSGDGESKAGGDGWSLLEETVIEFGTPHEILFLAKHPLEFADAVLVESKDGALRAEASVVAAQYHPERTVIAARFLKQVPNWIVKS
ncbi:MAG: hypothetical protein WCC04_16285 [Terriglobales bacterium]